MNMLSPYDGTLQCSDVGTRRLPSTFPVPTEPPLKGGSVKAALTTLTHSINIHGSNNETRYKFGLNIMPQLNIYHRRYKFTQPSIVRWHDWEMGRISNWQSNAFYYYYLQHLSEKRSLKRWTRHHRNCTTFSVWNFSSENRFHHNLWA